LVRTYFSILVLHLIANELQISAGK
jgi:hypothetical protein